MPRQSVYDMDFTRVYAALVAKTERKGRTKEEVDQVIKWLTGYVQGVGFRWRARHAANLYGCTGWVRNEWDDSMTMELTGRLARKTQNESCEKHKINV